MKRNLFEWKRRRWWLALQLSPSPKKAQFLNKNEFWRRKTCDEQQHSSPFLAPHLMVSLFSRFHFHLFLWFINSRQFFCSSSTMFELVKYFFGCKKMKGEKKSLQSFVQTLKQTYVLILRFFFCTTPLLFIASFLDFLFWQGRINLFLNVCCGIGRRSNVWLTFLKNFKEKKSNQLFARALATLRLK